MIHKMLRPFIVKVSVLGYFPQCVFSFLYNVSFIYIFYYVQIKVLYFSKIKKNMFSIIIRHCDYLYINFQ